MKTKGKMKKELRLTEEQLSAAVKKVSDNHEIYKTSHFQEQLYLMGKWGFSTEMIKNFMGLDLSLQDVDFFRTLLLITKDFDYIKSNFIETEFLYEDAIAKAVGDLLEKQYPVSEVEGLQREKERLKTEFELHKSFLEKEFELTQQLADERHNHEKEIITIEGGSEQKILKTENEYLKKRIEELNVAMNISQPKKRRFGFGKHFPFCTAARKEETKEDFIVSVLHNLEFQPDQYAIILAAVENGLPLEDIRKIAQPSMPPNNMQLLCQMFYKQRGINITETNLIGTLRDKGYEVELLNVTNNDTNEKQTEE